jgi:hypothetical protein
VTEAGYFGTLDDGKDTLAALQTYRQTSERWKAAYEDLKREFTATAEGIQNQVDALESQIDVERKAWKSAVASGQTNVLWVILGAVTVVFAVGR